MFLAHHAAAFAAKPLAPRTSLGTLIGAAIALDLIWPVLLLLGLEHVRVAPGNTAATPLDFYDYPISHSLLNVLGWAMLCGLLYWFVRRSVRGAVIIGILITSHWFLDFAAHRPDLPLWPGSAKYGLGMWSSVPLTIAVELTLFLSGLFVYAHATRARDRVGSIALISLIAFLCVVYALNLTMPPPPNARAIGWAGLAQWLFVPWGAWIDRHREARA
jgi:membrane-bound metal-dependent hydrolase YbcI (DUF457 family)